MNGSDLGNDMKKPFKFHSTFVSIPAMYDPISATHCATGALKCTLYVKHIDNRIPIREVEYFIHKFRTWSLLNSFLPRNSTVLEFCGLKKARLSSCGSSEIFTVATINGTVCHTV
jgi:hypothetical protein